MQKTRVAISKKTCLEGKHDQSFTSGLEVRVFVSMDKNWDIETFSEMQSSNLNVGLMEYVVLVKQDECLNMGMKYRHPSIVPSRSTLIVCAWHRTWYCYTIRCGRYDSYDFLSC